MRGHSFPGRVKSKAYKKHRAILDKLFKKFKKQNKARKLIFVSHVPPKDTRLDKIWMKAPKEVRGKHFGSKLARRMINKYQPILNICGHVHEAWGKQKIRKTLSVNHGAVLDKRAAIITLEGKSPPKVKFIRT